MGPPETKESRLLFSTDEGAILLVERRVLSKGDAGGGQVKKCSPGYVEQAPSRGHEASPQSGLSAGCMLCSSSSKLRELNVRAQAQRIRTSLSFLCFGGFLVPVSPAQRDEARRVEVLPGEI